MCGSSRLIILEGRSSSGGGATLGNASKDIFKRRPSGTTIAELKLLEKWKW